VRYLVVGAYVGLATAAGFVWWYLLAPVRSAECCHLQLSDGVELGVCHVALCCAPLGYATVACSPGRAAMVVRPKRVHPHAGRSAHQLGPANQLPELPGGQGGVQLQDLRRPHPAHHLNDGETVQLLTPGLRCTDQAPLDRPPVAPHIWCRSSIVISLVVYGCLLAFW
jgi:hypothetical protein